MPALRASNERARSRRDDLSQSVVLRLSKITVDPAKDRRGRDSNVRDLLESLTDVGLLHPVLVLPADDEGYHELLAGHRRLRAARELGWEEISARIVTFEGLRAELASLAENLARKALPPSEELRAIVRAKIIYENLHPDARRGGARRGASASSRTESFADYAASRTGLSPRTVRRRAMVGERASTDILDALDEGTISLGQAEESVASTASRGAPEAGDSPEGPSAQPDPALPVEAPLPLDQQALLRSLNKLLHAAQATVPRLLGLAEAMDPATRQLCRDHLGRIQESITEALNRI